MDSIKEIFEAMGQRIRSPFWGYVFLSFTLLNWKPLFYLLFAERDVAVKFRFFDNNTDWQSLYLLPLLLGLGATLASPFISEYAARWAEKPINRKRIREVDAAHQVLQAKNKFAAERENERSIFERSLVDQAKVDEQVETISDPERRKEVSDKIEGGRSTVKSDSTMRNMRAMFIPDGKEDDEGHSLQKALSSLSDREVLTLKLLGRSTQKFHRHELEASTSVRNAYGEIISNLTKKRFAVELAASLKQLAGFQIAADRNGDWVLTEYGYKLYDLITD